MSVRNLIAKPIVAAMPAPTKRSLVEVLTPLDRIATNSPNLIANHEAKFEAGGQAFELPRYLFIGPKGGGEPIRVGLFAGIHGDEPEGVHALVSFLGRLEAQPELAT